MYQLDYLDCLMAWVTPVSILFIGIIGVPLIFIAWQCYQVKKRGFSRPYRSLLLSLSLFICILGTASLLLSWSMVGSGWRLEGNLLKLKAPPATTTIELQASNVTLTEASGPWRPTLRVGGYGTPGLATGNFKLENGKKAIVFRHLRPNAMVVIESRGRYYVIAHPGVEKLYEELVARGAQPAKL